jgi:hypothetical protein
MPVTPANRAATALSAMRGASRHRSSHCLNRRQGKLVALAADHGMNFTRLSSAAFAGGDNRASFSG